MLQKRNFCKTLHRTLKNFRTHGSKVFFKSTGKTGCFLLSHVSDSHRETLISFDSVLKNRINWNLHHYHIQK